MGGRYDEASGDRRAHLGSKVQNAATDIAKSYVVAEAQMQARRKAFEAQVCARSPTVPYPNSAATYEHKQGACCGGGTATVGVDLSLIRFQKLIRDTVPCVAVCRVCRVDPLRPRPPSPLPVVPSGVWRVEERRGHPLPRPSTRTRSPSPTSGWR